MTTSDSPIFPSPGEDQEMEAAAKQARQTFRFFWRELSWEQRRIVPGLQIAALKAKFTDPPETTPSKGPDALEAEQMWLNDIEFDGREIHGTLLNSPHSLQSVKEGDRLKVPGKQMTDWMYVIYGDVYGGFTVDLLRSRMSGSERKQHDQAWGFNFGDLGIVDLVPPEYIGDPPKKKGFFSRLLGAKAEPQDHAKVAATEHPMSVNMRESLEESLGEKPDYVHEADERGFTLLHQLALAGSLDGVEVCLNHGADPNQPASNGMTPFALAKCLGWKKVMARLEQAGTA